MIILDKFCAFITRTVVHSPVPQVIEISAVPIKCRSETCRKALTTRVKLGINKSYVR